MFDLGSITSSKKRFRVLCCALIAQEDGIILIQEAEKKVYGRWSIPGGLIEHGENIFEATKREVKEETNLDVDLRGLIGVYNWYSKNYKTGEACYIFQANNVRGEIKPQTDEILSAKLFTFREIVAMPDDSWSAPQFRQVIKDFRRGKLYPLEVITVL